MSESTPTIDPNTVPTFVINAQYLKDLSFEHPNAPRSLLQPVQPNVDLKVNVTSRPLGDVQTENGLVNGVFEVQLALRATAISSEVPADKEATADDTVFIVDMVYAGLVTCQLVPENDLRPLLLIEGPRMLFPYARNIMLTITAEGGFPPLMVNPIDFAIFYQQNFIEENEINVA